MVSAYLGKLGVSFTNLLLHVTPDELANVIPMPDERLGPELTGNEALTLFTNHYDATVGVVSMTRSYSDIWG